MSEATENKDMTFVYGGIQPFTDILESLPTHETVIEV